MKRKNYAFVKGFLYLAMAATTITACKDEEPEAAPSLYVGETTTFVMSANGETKTIELQANVAITLNTQGTAEWCKATLSGKTLTVVAEPNTALASRSTTLEVSVPGKAETLTFEQGGQPSVKLRVASATASSEQQNYSIANTYDGITDGSIHYHSDWNAPGEQFELTYNLEPDERLELSMVAYYARPKTISSTTGLPVCPNGTFGKMEVWVATGGAFTKVKDFTCGDPINNAAEYSIPAYIELDEPIAGVTAVKIVADGATSKGGFASCNEMEFYGTGTPGYSQPYLLTGKSTLAFGAGGGSEDISVVTNATNITASGANGWCTVTVTGLFVNIAAAENSTSQSRTATVTITGDNGQTGTITISQARVIAEGAQLTVDAKSHADSYYDEDATDDAGNVTGGPFNLTFDDKYTTYWHSNYDDERIEELGPVTPPYNLYYYLTDAAELSYIVYYPRNYPTGGNGNFAAIEIWVSTGNDNFTKVMDYNCGGKGTESKIDLPDAISNVEAVQIVVKTDLGSCSEMAFFGTKK